MNPSRLFLRWLAAVLASLAVASAPCPVWGQIEPSAPTQSSGASTSPSAQPMPPAPPADEPVDARTVVRLSDVEGTVRLSDSSGKGFSQAMVNMAVMPGMTVETGNDGRAELEFPDGSVARVTPNSALAIAGPVDDSLNHAYPTLKAVRGLTYYEFEPGGESFAVQVGPLTAHASAAAQQALLRVNLDATPYEAAALRGTVHFEDASGNAAYDLETNQTARIDPAAANNYDIALEVTQDSWDAWNTDRDEALSKIAGASHAGEANAGPGWNDLNYYGSWYDVPGEGMAWAPDGVGDDFDPYGSGAWGYYTTAGYSWVSAYPWGWLPYHCGLWNYQPNYGWMWRPAGCGWGPGRRWYPYSTVRGGGNVYRFPVRPSPPRGSRPTAPMQTLIAVHQGPAVRFRALGDPRPPARSLVVSGSPVQPLPVESRPGYRSGVAPGTEPGGPGSTQVGAGVPQFGYVTRGGAQGYGASQGAASGFVPRIPTVPRTVYTQPARPSAPAAMPAPPAPHAAAPAAPGGHGH